MGHIISLLLLFTCNLTAKIATPPMYKTDSSLTVLLVVQAGTPPYSYEWNNGSKHDTAIYLNETGKIIICNVTDSKGCMVHDVLILGE
jgi:hypothetical protein